MQLQQQQQQQMQQQQQQSNRATEQLLMMLSGAGGPPQHLHPPQGAAPVPRQNPGFIINNQFVHEAALPNQVDPVHLLQPQDAFPGPGKQPVLFQTLAVPQAAPLRTRPLPPPDAAPSLLSHQPLMTERYSPLSPDEALMLLTGGTSYTSSVQDFAKAKGGEVYLHVSENLINSKDWKHAGHIFIQRNGLDRVHSRNDPERPIFKKVALIVTQEQKGGHKGFKRYSWQLEEKDTKKILIQFIGDSNLSKPVIHGNSKSQKPRQPVLPSTAERMKRMEGIKKPARVYEEMRLTAGSTAMDQVLYSPSSKSQVKNFHRNVRSKRRAAEPGGGDNMVNLLRMSQEFDDIKLLVVNPRLLVVSFFSCI